MSAAATKQEGLQHPGCSDGNLPAVIRSVLGWQSSTLIKDVDVSHFLVSVISNPRLNNFHLLQAHF